MTDDTDEQVKRDFKNWKKAQGQNKTYIADFLHEVQVVDGVISVSNAEGQVARYAKGLQRDGLHESGLNHTDWFKAEIKADPTIAGLRSGRETEHLDAADVVAWLRDGDMTALTRLGMRKPILQLHAIARQHGKRDAFDRTSPYQPVSVRKEGEPARKVNSGGGVNPWLPHTFNLTAQARTLRDDSVLAAKQMAEAGATKIGMTQKQLRGR